MSRAHDSGPSAARRACIPAFLAVLAATLMTDPEASAQTRAVPFEVHEASILDLQDALARGAVTSADLVDAYLARIEAYDSAPPALNAILRINPRAREEAGALDRERAERGARGPLHGIPVILKDNLDTADLPTTASAAALADHRPGTDAFQVRRLREAGAVLLAKSNLQELAYGITTISSLGGQTLNPYDPRRNPGGSSGGTSAGIAASFAAIGWGTDTCGSIRIPAAVTNLFGLRPTKGLSSIDGVVPMAPTQDVAGPLARTVTDLAIGLDATIGPDPADPATHALTGRELPRFVDALDAAALRGARIGILVDYYGDGEEEQETNRVVHEALDAMRRAGAELVEVRIDGMDDLLTGASLIPFEMKWALMDYFARTPEAPVRTLEELLALGLHHPAVDENLRRADASESRDPPALAEVRAKRTALLAATTALLEAERLDAVAYPTIRREAALIGQPAIGSNCLLSAATGLPALAIPAGFSAGGVPVGVELLGRAFDDARLVALAFAYEQATAPRRAPASTPPLTQER